ncbi:MAG: methylmalonyl-CoA mutase [Bacteroidetes bacterium RIFCSPLOWO2_02_FULL_36_8]|nr:MAG: methylmalonyl-CoA mutase [Bacteroidetes bacterium RIFCSPLOWO2_02_FULL_36_8]OFY71525.1 MAG: methylmalonyl-CoA mutase [Bacteroidetes bacterium RIFCSPLOWO2_12_FULL_37_12]
MKILLAKPGLDGHDVGVKVLAHALIEAGWKVVYTGLRKSIEEIVEKAIKEKPNLIGLSILSGTHLILCERFRDVLLAKNVKIQWIIGGNIPEKDVIPLENLGATKAFPTGTKIQTVVDFVKGHV